MITSKWQIVDTCDGGNVYAVRVGCFELYTATVTSPAFVENCNEQIDSALSPMLMTVDKWPATGPINVGWVLEHRDGELCNTGLIGVGYADITDAMVNMHVLAKWLADLERAIADRRKAA